MPNIKTAQSIVTSHRVILFKNIGNLARKWQLIHFYLKKKKYCRKYFSSWKLFWLLRKVIFLKKNFRFHKKWSFHLFRIFYPEKKTMDKKKFYKNYFFFRKNFTDFSKKPNTPSKHIDTSSMSLNSDSSQSGLHSLQANFYIFGHFDPYSTFGVEF